MNKLAVKIDPELGYVLTPSLEVRGKLNQPGSLGIAALTSRKIEVKHESSCFGCNGRNRATDRPVPPWRKAIPSWPWFARRRAPICGE
jgi:hypothetical protein